MSDENITTNESTEDSQDTTATKDTSPQAGEGDPLRLPPGWLDEATDEGSAADDAGGDWDAARQQLNQENATLRKAVKDLQTKVAAEDTATAKATARTSEIQKHLDALRNIDPDDLGVADEQLVAALKYLPTLLEQSSQTTQDALERAQAAAEAVKAIQAERETEKTEKAEKADEELLEGQVKAFLGKLDELDAMFGDLYRGHAIDLGFERLAADGYDADNPAPLENALLAVENGYFQATRAHREGTWQPGETPAVTLDSGHGGAPAGSSGQDQEADFIALTGTNGLDVAMEQMAREGKLQR